MVARPLAKIFNQVIRSSVIRLSDCRSKHWDFRLVKPDQIRYLIEPDGAPSVPFTLRSIPWREIIASDNQELFCYTTGHLVETGRVDWTAYHWRCSVLGICASYHDPGLTYSFKYILTSRIIAQKDLFHYKVCTKVDHYLLLRAWIRSVDTVIKKCEVFTDWGIWCENISGQLRPDYVGML